MSRTLVSSSPPQREIVRCEDWTTVPTEIEDQAPRQVSAVGSETIVETVEGLVGTVRSRNLDIARRLSHCGVTPDAAFVI